MIDLLHEFGSAFYDDPYRCYAQIRDSDPMPHVILPDSRECRLVLTFADAMRIFSSNALTNRRPGTPPGSMIVSDPPRHTVLRRSVMSAFSRAGVAMFPTLVSDIVQQRLGVFPPGPDIDLVGEFAAVVAATVIGRVLGTPLQDEPWLRAIVATDTGVERMHIARGRLSRHLEALVSDDVPVDQRGLIHRLRTISRTENISKADLVATVALIVIAGYESTTNLIANTLLCYADLPCTRPPAPDAALQVETLVAETLRHHPPLNLSAARYVVRDVKLSGRRVLTGDGSCVIVSIASVNRDPARFERPDVFDMSRNERGDLAFGSGIHRCPGSALAVAVTRRAVAELIARHPRMRRREPTEWQSSCLNRAQQTLTVGLDDPREEGGRPCSPTQRF